MIKYKPFASNKNSFKCHQPNDLNEKMSISFDVYDEVKKVVKKLNDLIKDKSNLQSVAAPGTFFGAKFECFNFIKLPSIEIFGCDCLMHVNNIFKISGKNLSKFDKRCITRSLEKHLGETKMGSTTSPEFIKNEFGEREAVGKVDLIFYGDLIVFNDEISSYSTQLLAHEMRHAYIRVKMYNGAPVTDVVKRTLDQTKWDEIYNSVGEFLMRYNNNPDHTKNKLKNLGLDYDLIEHFYAAIYSIYSSDTTEIAAFTQQAFEMCAECKTKESANRIIENSDLHKIKSLFEVVIEKFNDEKFASEYDKIKDKINKKLPTSNQLIKHLTKRYKKLLDNYSKLKTLVYEMIDDKNDVINVNVKF